MPTKQLAFPTGTVELVINLREEPLRVYHLNADFEGHCVSSSVLCGPHSKHFVIDSSPDEYVIGVNFKPGGLFPFINIHADELHNALIPLDALWNSRAHQLRDKLMNACTNSQRFQRLEAFLFRLAFRPLMLDARVAYSLSSFMRGPSEHRISVVADDLGLSHRQFIENFRMTTGYRPKQFLRIQRFQQVLRLIDQGEAHSLADLAYACGFYDQSHFARDFREMTGISPSDYMKKCGERVNHIEI